MAEATVISTSGDLALSVLEYEGRGQVSNYPFDLGLMFTVRLTPQGDKSRLIVLVDYIFEKQLEEKAQELGLTVDQLHVEIGLQAIGQYLDENGMPEFTPSGKPAVLISGNPAAQSYFDRDKRWPPSDDDILAFIAAKAYWGWRFGDISTSMRLSDAKRLAIPVKEFARVAIAGDGVYWSRQDAFAEALVPTSKLIGDVPSGAFPGLARPLLPRIVDRLGAPRYSAAKQHFGRALELFDGSPPDYANAIKEAVAAVESVGLLVTGKEKGTLGDVIKDLRHSGRLKPQLAKALESLWGYSSEEPGVRHGKTDAPDVNASEAAFMLSLAGSGLLLLLEMDR